MSVSQNRIEVIVWSCQSQEDGFKLKCSSMTLHFIFLLQTDFTVGEGDAVWNFEYWCQLPACIFFQSAYFVWMMRHIVGPSVQLWPKTLSQRDFLWFSKNANFSWSGLSRMILKSVIYSGQSKIIEHPDQAQWQKMVEIPLTRELPERPAQCFSCQSTILSPFIMRVGDFTLQSWNLISFKWFLCCNSDRKTA